MIFLLRLLVEDKQKMLNTERRRNEKLVSFLIPKQLTNKFRNNPKELVEAVPNGSVLAIDILGFGEMEGELNSVQVQHFLNALFAKLENLSEVYSSTLLKSASASFMVTLMKEFSFTIL